jgi:hypothetical protein
VTSKLSKIGWYFHRLRAMTPREVALHFEKKIHQRSDARGLPDFWQLDLTANPRFPVLPRRSEAPVELLNALRHEVAEILAGRWLAFGHLPLRVDDPPRWQYDYFVGEDFQTSTSAFKLDHRAQPGGADIKVIWEPNRWYQLFRLAEAAWLMEDVAARDKCIAWLMHWAKTNPPFTGLNWTSGLETGIRLVQYTWIDALLLAAGTDPQKLDEVRRVILPPHQWYTWRYRSFGSSANNHLLGELAGVILANARWPGLEKISASLREIQPNFEHEVRAQFAPDGGNREQGLGYHLFSWEFCWQSVLALEASGLPVSPAVHERLGKGEEFFVNMKQPNSTWDFGDSDDAFVTPFFADECKAAEEWRQWFLNPSQSPAIQFFAPRKQKSTGVKIRDEGWHFYPDSGMATFRSGDWFLRWDLSPLGYLSMAPHGHLDALHVSLWHKGKAIIIDPGTGCYHADKEVRSFFADWAAHNGPRFRDAKETFPERRGTFLWGSHHEIPKFEQLDSNSARGTLVLPSGRLVRQVTFIAETQTLIIEDSIDGSEPIATTWKFPPGLVLTGPEHDREEWILKIGNSGLEVVLSGGHIIYNPPHALENRIVYRRTELGDVPIESLCSPSFRALQSGPFLKLSHFGEEAAKLTFTIQSPSARAGHK